LKHHNSLKPLSGYDFEKEDICEVIFSHKKTVEACRCFIKWLKNNGSQGSRSEVSLFAYNLAKGRVRKGFRYRRENFYRTLLKRLLDLGFISLQPRYDPENKRNVSYKYAFSHQPIPKKPPLGGRSFWRLAWEVAKKWNEESEN